MASNSKVAIIHQKQPSEKKVAVDENATVVFADDLLDSKTNKLLSHLRDYSALSITMIVQLKRHFIDNGYTCYALIESDIFRESRSSIREFCNSTLQHAWLYDILYYLIIGRQDQIDVHFGENELNLKNVLYVNEPSKYIVSGYIRKHILAANHLQHIIVPPLVTALCALWFSYNSEKVLQYSNQHMIVSGEDDVIETNGKSANAISTAYGCHEIDDGKYIHSWTIRVLKLQENSTIYIGIDASNQRNVSKDFSDPHVNTYDYYAYCSDGVLWSKFRREAKCFAVGDGNGFGVNDVISIEVNTKKNEVRYVKNMQDIYVSDRIDLRDNIVANTDVFHLAIAMRGDCKVQIIASS